MSSKHYERFKRFELNEVLPLIGKTYYNFLSPEQQEIVPIRYLIGPKMNLIARTQDCAVCKVKGSHFWLERHGRALIPHFNLYAKSYHKHEVLMTIDHIIPLGRGGNNKQDNLQLMCYHCNQMKGHLDVSNEEVLKLRCKKDKIIKEYMKGHNND